MRKLNLRWLAGLVLGSMGLAVCGYLLHEFQTWRNAPSFLREAKRSQAENRFDNAADYLRRYVKLAPNDMEGLILYGFQLADLNRVSGAYLTLEKAIQRQPDRMDVRRRLVPLAIGLQRYSDAMDHLQNYLLKESPKDPELLEQESNCYIAKGEFDNAEKSLITAIENAPDRLEAYRALAVLQSKKLDRPDDANQLINLMVDRNSENFLAYLYRASWEMQRWQQSKASLKGDVISNAKTADELLNAADADAKKALELAPENADVMAFAMAVAQAAGRSVDVRELAQRGLDLHPSDTRFYTALVDLLSNAEDQAAAVDWLKRGVVAAPKDAGLKWKLANLLIGQDRFEEALDLVLELRAAKYPVALVDFLNAKIEIRRNEWRDAIVTLERILPELSDLPDVQKQANLLLGLAYRATNSLERQLIYSAVRSL